jgi:hypothetical protein
MSRVPEFTGAWRPGSPDGPRGCSFDLSCRGTLRGTRHGDLDVAMQADPPEDWVVVDPEIDAVEQVLLRFLDDLEAIRLPAAVDYPEPPPAFARQRTLEDVLAAA